MHLHLFVESWHALSGRSTECSAITILFAWFPITIFIAWTTSKRPHLEFRTMALRSCYRTRRKSIDRQLTPVSICCSAAIPTAAKFVCRGRSPSRSAQFCHAASERAHGYIITWPDTRRPVLDRQSCPCALTVCRKSLCTASGVPRNH